MLFARLGLPARRQAAKHGPQRSMWHLPGLSPGLAWIIVVGVCLRVGSALYQGDAVEALPGIYDQISYDTLARQLLAGRGFSFPVDWWPVTRAGEPTAHWSFLYTLYLTAVYTVFGVHPLAARLIQAVLVGVLHPLLACRIGARLFGPRVGLVAAGLSALYPYFIYYGGSLMTEPFYILAVLWVLDLATGKAVATQPIDSASGQRRQFLPETVGPWSQLGLALGVAVLMRQVVVLIIPLLFLWIIWVVARRQSRVDPRRHLFVGLTITLVVLSALVLPWTARNYLAFGRFVPLNTNAGYAFFWANHPIHGVDFMSIFPSHVYIDLIPPELRSLDEAALDQALLRRGANIVGEDPVRYLQLSLSRVKAYFQFWPSESSSPLSNVARVLSFGAALPFALCGLSLPILRRRSVVDGQGPAVVLLCLFIAAYSAIHLLSWALIRYRLPVDGVLLLFASLAVVNLAEQVTHRQMPHIKKHKVPLRPPDHGTGIPERT